MNRSALLLSFRLILQLFELVQSFVRVGESLVFAGITSKKHWLPLESDLDWLAH